MSGVLKQMTITGTEQPEVAHFDEARREHVLEEATDELFGGHGGVPELISGRFFVGESDVAVPDCGALHMAVHGWASGI